MARRVAVPVVVDVVATRTSGLTMPDTVDQATPSMARSPGKLIAPEVIL